jgi:hypothetical protein
MVLQTVPRHAHVLIPRAMHSVDNACTPRKSSNEPTGSVFQKGTTRFRSHEVAYLRAGWLLAISPVVVHLNLRTSYERMLLCNDAFLRLLLADIALVLGVPLSRLFVRHIPKPRSVDAKAMAVVELKIFPGAEPEPATSLSAATPSVSQGAMPPALPSGRASSLASLDTLPPTVSMVVLFFSHFFEIRLSRDTDVGLQ